MTSRKYGRGRRSSSPETSGPLFDLHVDRKVLQLCAQAERALRLALGESPEPDVVDLLVDRVQPYPNASRLMVWVQPPLGAEPVDRTAILAALGRDKGRLRAVMADSIHRKRTPELCFELAPTLGEVDPWA